MKNESWKLKITIASLFTCVIISVGYLLYLRHQAFQTGNTAPQNNNMSYKENMRKVRLPAVAGSFYPADGGQLSEEIEKYLQNVRIENVDKVHIPKIILVPHAGYEYSGQTAAYGYNLLAGRDIRKVILLGSSHNYPISGIVSDDSASWETPLGKVDLDKELISRLQVPINSEPFKPEHSLEVQVPFLQKVLLAPHRNGTGPAGFKIIPILVGDMNSVETRYVLSLLKKNIDEDTVVIVSSDLSHYPSSEDANKHDRETINSILTGDPENFNDTIAKLEQKNVPNAATFMCAEEAVKLALALAKELNVKDVKLLDYANSGDATGDKSRVVGYAAIGFFSADEGNKEYGRELLKMARDSVETFVKNDKILNFDSDGTGHPLFLRQKSGVFVTLRNSGNLRGCIGLIESDLPLYKTVPQMAVAAAVDDPRFNPVTKEDLPNLKYEVSVLSPMKKINEVSEIELGKHGVKIQNNGKSGVFLPQVAEETGWSKEEFLDHLCWDKAGLSAGCWKDPATEIYTFTAQVFSE